MNRLLAEAKACFRIIESEKVRLYGLDARGVTTIQTTALGTAQSRVLGTGGCNRYTPAPSPSRFIILFSQSDT
jgi:hypothetical protein